MSRSPLANRTFRHLFTAQVLSLLGTGLTTVALGLLAYELAGEAAGAVLGTALFLKMVAYVGLSPIAGALVARLPRRQVLVALDLFRAAVALCLPFVGAIWQIYALIFLLQCASAAFTPAFQATIPDVLEDEETYTRALSFSRLAYDLESLFSPMLAAALLLILPFSALFAGNALGFIASAALVMSAGLPPRRPGAAAQAPFRERVTSGLRLYLATPSLRGLLALNGTVAAVGAIVLVNTVVLVRDVLGRAEADLALALAAYGAGSMAVAVSLPRILRHLPDRRVMLTGGAALVAGGAVLALALISGTLGWAGLLAIWAWQGMAMSAVMTPSARLLRRAADSDMRPAIFTAQFTLSHACWLIAYPLAGHVGNGFGQGAATMLLVLLGGLCVLLAPRLWPAAAPAPSPA